MEKVKGSNNFNNGFFVLCVFVFAITVYRAVVVPFSNDESITFFDFAQNGAFLPYHSIVMANNHFLNSFLVWICYHLFGDSALSLRLPNLLGLLILMVATYRLAKRLTQTSSKIILVTGLLLSFHWLSFFNMSRGYGISLSFMALALSYIPDYAEGKRVIHILKIYALLSLAVGANLTLILTVAIITVLICFYQLYKRQFFKAGNLVALCIHAAIMMYWIRYLLFLQGDDHLHAGPGGGGYWKLTFVSLIDTIAGKQNLWINLSAVLVYFMIMISGVYFLIKNKRRGQSNQAIFVLFLAIALNGLIIGVYLLNKFLGIGYPENRTALVFYLLFILNAAFIVDTVNPSFSKVFGALWLIVFVIHFVWSVNFTTHPLAMYRTIPDRYYDRLEQEQKQQAERITIGGNDFFEPIYGFMNYSHDGALNYMNYSDDMLMNTDYYITVKRARPYYAPFYNEIDSDDNTEFVLLKRKQSLVRKPLFTYGKQDIKMDTGREYFNFFEKKDTLLSSPNPLLLEFNFKVLSGSMPTFAWLVLSVDSAEGKTICYKRIPLNRVKQNWLDSRGNGDLILETGVLHSKVHRLVCYLWNVGHQKIELEMNSVNVFQIEGPGACISAPSVEIIPPK